MDIPNPLKALISGVVPYHERDVDVLGHLLGSLEPLLQFFIVEHLENTQLDFESESEAKTTLSLKGFGPAL